MAKWPLMEKIVQSGAESWSPDSKINSPGWTGFGRDAWRQIKIADRKNTSYSKDCSV